MELSSIVQSKETGGKRVRHGTLNVEGSRYYQKIRAEAKAVEAADNKKKLGISVDEEGDYEEEEKGAISEEKDNQIDALQKHYSNSPICREQLQRLQRTLSSPKKPNCIKPASAPPLTNPAWLGLKRHESELKLRGVYPPPDAAANESGQLLRFVEKQIGDAEKELECPVCLEIALEAPIFSCQEDHLICSKCRVKVLSCPVCRVEYPRGGRKRLRGAEKQAEKLLEMYKERKRLLHSKCCPKKCRPQSLKNLEQKKLVTGSQTARGVEGRRKAG